MTALLSHNLKRRNAARLLFYLSTCLNKLICLALLYNSLYGADKMYPGIC
jgi:hypothetical protein